MTDRIFNSREAAKFITAELQMSIKDATLRLKRTNGTGPLYCRVWGRIEYTETDLREWVEQCRSKKFRSTAEESAAAA